MRLAAKLRRAFTGRWWDYLASVGRGGGRPAYGGVTGRIAFDSLGDVPTKPVLIAVVHGGRLVTEWQP